MKVAMVELTENEYEDLKPLLKRTNRNYKNFCQSIVLAAIRAYKNDRQLLDIHHLGIINNKEK